MGTNAAFQVTGRAVYSVGRRLAKRADLNKPHTTAGETVADGVCRSCVRIAPRLVDGLLRRNCDYPTLAQGSVLKQEPA